MDTFTGAETSLYVYLLDKVDCLVMLSPGFASYPVIVSASIFMQIRVISVEDQSRGFGVERR